MPTTPAPAEPPADAGTTVPASTIEERVPAAVQSGPEVLGWLEFGDAARLLAKDVVDSGFVPDVVVAVARGGLIIAGAVAYALGTKMCGSINVEFYTDVEKRLDEPIVLAPALDAPSLAGKRVLVVDDVSDSGRTLALVVGIVRQAGADVRGACLDSKPGTVLDPDFVWRRVDGWITFPWSAMAPVEANA